MSNRKNVTVPELDHDAMMLERFGHHVQPHGRIERRIVAALCAHMLDRGWTPANVFDGEETTKVTDAKSAMELIFNLDEASLRFRPTDSPSGKRHGVLLVLGNGEDIVSDWNYTEGDPDGFCAAMDAFNAEDYL